MKHKLVGCALARDYNALR